MNGEYVENDHAKVETDEHTYEISYSVRFVDDQFRCVARLRYDYQSWRYDPIHKKLRIVDNEHDIQQGLQEVIDSCRDAIERVESADNLDLSVTVK